MISNRIIEHVVGRNSALPFIKVALLRELLVVLWKTLKSGVILNLQIAFIFKKKHFRKIIIFDKDT